MLYKIMPINDITVVKLMKSRRNQWDLKQRRLVELMDYLQSTSHFNFFVNYGHSFTLITSYHAIGKFLISLLNPLEQYEYVVKDSSEAAAKINSILWNSILVMNILSCLLTLSWYSQTSH